MPHLFENVLPCKPAHDAFGTAQTELVLQTFGRQIAEYNLSRDAFAEIMKQCADNGALLLGGCCGTTPEYIAAVKQAIQP